MPNREEYKQYFEILELPEDATPEQIKDSYRSLAEKYSNRSQAEKDVSGEHNFLMLKQVEEAFRVLSEQWEEKHGNQKKAENESQPEKPEESIVYNGRKLRQTREEMNVDLADISDETKIHTRILENIESENFDALPPEVYVRGFVKGYAAFLSLDPAKVAGDYMKRYQDGKKEGGKRVQFRLSRKKGSFSIKAKK